MLRSPMNSNAVLVAILGGSAVLLGACASTTIESIQRAPGFDAAGIRKVLVVGALKRPDIRKAFEDDYVRRFKARRVDAVASMGILPSGTPLSRAGVVGLADAQGFDTILVTRLMDQEQLKPQIAHP